MALILDDAHYLGGFHSRLCGLGGYYIFNG